MVVHVEIPLKQVTFIEVHSERSDLPDYLIERIILSLSAGQTLRLTTHTFLVKQFFTLTLKKILAFYRPFAKTLIHLHLFLLVRLLSLHLIVIISLLLRRH